MTPFAELALFDAVARAAEAEQVGANRATDFAQRAALADAVLALAGPPYPFDADAFRAQVLAAPPLSNLYTTTVGGGAVPLSPGFEIQLMDGPLTQATATLGTVVFTARDPGAGGNGIVVTAVLDTKLSPVTPDVQAAPNTASVMLYDILDSNADYVVEIVDPGGLGTATYRLNGGSTTTTPMTPPSPLPLATTFVFLCTPGQAYVAGDRFTFSKRRRFIVTASRGELVLTYGQMSESQQPYAPDMLFGSISAGILEPGAVELSRGTGGVAAAITGRLETALAFPDISAATRQSINQALAQIAAAA